MLVDQNRVSIRIDEDEARGAAGAFVSLCLEFEALGLEAAPLPLEEVAKAACFSPYHFHRIFHGLMGETLAAFVKRIRLERAVYLLSHREGASLTGIALACGFFSSSDFSRSRSCPARSVATTWASSYLRELRAISR